MPYIKQEDRVPFIPHLENVVRLILITSDLIVRGEKTAYFCYCMIKNFLGQKKDVAFGSNFFSREDELTLTNEADNIFKKMACKSFIVQSGEINYVCSAVIWSVLGEDGKYALRAFIKGCLLNLLHHQIDFNNSRLHSMAKGVLADIIDETYRRRTALYEDRKMRENEDVLPLIYAQHPETEEEEWEEWDS